ncbi:MULTISPECIES: tRNA (guanosine(37)-N1)-methyltransferase TrmD [Anaeromyxobacter]|uniref:tRNA (guanine-N(1)-)-methyltransferase n=1 Tax=Anaeromyxobacter dehalogenans (strain 2CP-C) TaxID=290397 RepID=TRMD_ANADE|nr:MULTISPECIES: tRNA (guanosine(37)-N1)-methyltransferase TrmD [Anaeromyxobacter]Q2IJ54.1 RecName: Full=tRNA (guanine-N(1)-)-methyltransferase; AltName: Full=M1G-methyltransferase; AltName: Full=tRNA [GM37] methyltransferase [Anaeromyxobacter dehalogenans 2CP-C]ABC81684.1 tRNA (Guanine37-N(1)-) methyltransferase [Anaeromyxobacter dehalogenans 2CP-C]GAO03632.1 tRNA (guanine-N(1)-)-methyltransferase [Anaeromyxobacter sp. PSR-1]
MARLEVDILTLFPRMCAGYLGESILGKAQEAGLLAATITDIRDHATGKHRVCDDAPYGGGAGMVMKPEPLVEAIEAARARLPGAWVVLTSPRGARLDQALARRFAEHGRLILACGRYEGVDERVMTAVDMQVSIGDFVLTGGELAALCVVDAAARLVPGVLGNAASADAESFAGAEGLLEYPQYTRPPEFRGMRVPEVLLSGDHRRIERWRRREALRATRERRPDLFTRVSLPESDLRLIDAGDDEL